jgi:ligand-binding sensor domain-containing protein
VQYIRFEMNKNSNLIYLFLLLTLSFSCVEKKSTKQESNKTPIETNSSTDSLKFTSGIRAILHDSKGHYWFGSHSEGLGYFNGKSYEYYTTNEGLVDNRIRSIQEDTNGTIWIGTAMGVSAYAKGKFTNYLTNANKPIHNWNETIGDLWFYAGEEDGIGRFDGLNLNYLVFPKPQGAHSDNSYGVTDIAEAKDGKVWIATYAALFSYDGQVVNTFDEDKLNLKKNDLLHIRSVFADSKGRIWVGNNGIGVVLIEGNTTIHFSEKNNLIHPESKRRGDKSQPGTLEHVFAITEDTEGNIWFGDRDTGAWKYDGKTLTNYVLREGAQPMIWTIYKDRNNNLLFGLEDGSILKFNGKTFDKQF